MATRGTITVGETENRVYYKIYNHWDSYLDGLGAKLKDIISRCKIINGISSGLEEEQRGNPTGTIYCNGFSDFAATLIRELKPRDIIGGIYLLPCDNTQLEEFNYVITFDDFTNKIELQCYDSNGKLIDLEG